MNRRQRYNTDDPRVIAGMAAQGRARAQLLAGGADPVGWKAGLGTAAAMQKAGTRAPVAGYLTSATLTADHAPVSVDGWTAPTVEPELAVRVDRDVRPDAPTATVRAAIGAVAPAIELVDMAPSNDLEAVLAGNVFHRAFAVGPWCEARLDAARLTVLVDGDVHASGVEPAALLGDLTEVVRAIAAQAALADGGLRSGQLVITGSAIPAIGLGNGHAVAVELEGAGSVVSLRT